MKTKILLIVLFIPAILKAATAFEVTSSINSVAPAQNPPQVVLALSDSKVADATREFKYPTYFSTPQKAEGGIVPLWPSDFVDKGAPTGWRIDYTLKREGDSNILVGKATYTSASLERNVVGDIPFDSGDSKQGQFAVINSTTTYFQIFFKPNKPYTVTLNTPSGKVDAVITCKEVKTKS